jgi:subtilisin family serine protease/Tfp pilus assembly protein PilZ
MVNYVPGEVIVKLKQTQADTGVGKSELSQQKASNFLSKTQNQKGYALKASFDKMGVYHFKVKAGQKVEDAVAEMKADADVEYAEPNFIFNKATVGGVNQSFSIKEVSAMAGAGGYLATGAPIQVMSTWSIVSPNDVPVVAIIDTGLDMEPNSGQNIFLASNAVWTNPGEIAGNNRDDDGNGYVDDVNGWNFVAGSNDMLDDDGHGTHVAGIVLGVTQDIYVPPLATAKIKIMPLKFLDGSGYGKTSDAIKAIYYAVNNGASVLNNSWGGPSYSAALHEAIAYAYNAGVTFVAAAGNAGSNNDSQPMYPASYDVPNIISIAATTDTDALAYFSNFGQQSVQLASPGVFILSSLPGGGFGSMSGTSMAAPFVAGLAALMVAEKPGMLGYQVKEIIMSNIDVVMDGSGNPKLNNKVTTEGRMNVYNTVQATKSAVLGAAPPAYSFVNQDRELASSIAASGCGLVSKMIEKGSSGGGPSGATGLETWSVLLIVALFALPMIVYNVLRRKDVKQRRHERFKINSEVKVSVGDRELIGSISSISMGGVQLNTNAMLEQGGIVSMVIRSPDGQDQIEVEGRVVWSEAQKAYGVQFAETSETIRQRISRWTTALAKI